EADAPIDDKERRGIQYIRTVLPDSYLMSGIPDYEQPAESSIGAIAERLGVSMDEVLYDGLTATDDAVMLYPLYNYTTHDHSVLHEQLLDPDAVLGLNDGGAHCAFICDASIPTYMMSHWARDRTRGPKIAIDEVIRRLTSQPADLYGMSDRGRLQVGLRADANVIDFANVNISSPYAVNDLPAGGTRLLQKSFGYDITMVAGQITRRNGADTGARPGRLLRHGS
ncbi:MAG: amidohydrolase family protein, partial [Acidimicrobiia bacterium]